MDVRPMKYHWANVFFQPFAGLLMTFALTFLGGSHWSVGMVTAMIGCCRIAFAVACTCAGVMVSIAAR